MEDNDMAIRVGIFGYGNLGRGVEQARSRPPASKFTEKKPL